MAFKQKFTMVNLGKSEKTSVFLLVKLTLVKSFKEIGKNRFPRDTY